MNEWWPDDFTKQRWNEKEPDIHDACSQQVAHDAADSEKQTSVSQPQWNSKQTQKRNKINFGAGHILFETSPRIHVAADAGFTGDARSKSHVKSNARQS